MRTPLLAGFRTSGAGVGLAIPHLAVSSHRPSAHWRHAASAWARSFGASPAVRRALAGGGQTQPSKASTTDDCQGNIVNTQFTDLSRTLDELRSAIFAVDTVSDTDKLNVSADIDALQSQLQKPEPNQSVIRTLWDGIEEAANLAGAIDLVTRAGELLGPLIS